MQRLEVSGAERVNMLRLFPYTASRDWILWLRLIVWYELNLEI
jgi:hypothetical protein